MPALKERIEALFPRIRNVEEETAVPEPAKQMTSISTTRSRWICFGDRLDCKPEHDEPPHPTSLITVNHNIPRWHYHYRAHALSWRSANPSTLPARASSTALSAPQCQSRKTASTVRMFRLFSYSNSNPLGRHTHLSPRPCHSNTHTQRPQRRRIRNPKPALGQQSRAHDNTVDGIMVSVVQSRRTPD